MNSNNLVCLDSQIIFLTLVSQYKQNVYNTHGSFNIMYAVKG